LKMKLTALIVAVLTLVVSTAFPPLALPWLPLIVLAYAAYGVLRSRLRKLDYLNDIPNAVRVALAAAGGYLIGAPLNFVFPSAGIFLVVVSLYLNDEYQRRALLAMTEGRRGGSVALLGIDGSGKSTHAARLEKWFLSRGYYCTVVPFHRYLFVERLTRKGRGRAPGVGERGGNPLRPLLSLADNIILNLITSLGVGLEGRVVIYDRYIWSTYVKYRSLGYPVEPFSALYMLPRPNLAFVLDVPVTRSMEIIHGRGKHIRYASEVLKEEKEEYLKIAASRGYPVIDSTRNFETVQEELERRLERVFPTARRSGRS
jgi:thymidylate kinase